MNSDQQLFCNRLGIPSESLALAAQTGVLREFLAGRVKEFGEAVGYGRHPSGKGIETYEAALNRLWPQEKRNARK